MRLVYLALGWCVGIVLAANVGLHLPLLWLALAGMTALLALRLRRIEAAALLLFTLGGLRMALTPTSSGLAAYNGLGGMTITGVVVSEPESRDDGVQLRIQAETVTRAGTTTPTDGLVLVEAPPLTDAHYGDRVSATGTLSAPDSSSDRFSYADYLAQSGVYSIMRDTSVEVLTRRPRSDFFTILYSLNERANTVINQALPEPEAGLLAGILLGNDHGIAPEVSSAFAATGASHIIAISGFNMAILSGAVIGILRRLRVPRRASVPISLTVIAVYTLFVGANPAVVRAALMCGLLIVGQAIRRKTYLPASLAFAALVLSLLNPLVLWNISFQLSFFATLGIALFAEPLTLGFDALLARSFPQRAARWLSALLDEPLIVSLSALTLTLPLTVLYFGQLAPLALAVNLLILPAQPALLLLGGAATLTALLSPLIAQVVYWLDLIPLAWTIGVVRLFAQVPAVQVFVWPSVVAAFMIVIVGVAVVKAAQARWSLRLSDWLRRRALWGALLLSGVGMLALIGALYVSRPDGLLHVWMLNVGAGNAVLVQTPRGAHFLIDGGNAVSPLLTALGDRLPFTSRSLEVLFLTQPDEQQFGALPAVLDRYDVGAVVSNGQPNLSDAFSTLQAKLATRPLVTATAGYTLDSDDGVKIEALNPARLPALGDSLDANTLVLRLSYGNVSFLLTSELSGTGQAALLKSGEPLQAAVLQLPQQGAPRSLDKDFLAAVQPQVAVVEGSNPAAATLALLGSLPLYRTDQDGTIGLSSDGTHLWISRDTQP